MALQISTRYLSIFKAKKPVSGIGDQICEVGDDFHQKSSPICHVGDDFYQKSSSICDVGDDFHQKSSPICGVGDDFHQKSSPIPEMRNKMPAKPEVETKKRGFLF